MEHFFEALEEHELGALGGGEVLVVIEAFKVGAAFLGGLPIFAGEVDDLMIVGTHVELELPGADFGDAAMGCSYLVCGVGLGV